LSSEIERRLQPFLFPVVETEVMHGNVDGGIPSNTRDYKAIVRADNNQLISIMKDSYRVIPNSEIIKPMLEELNKLNSHWYIDNSHSFVDNSRMRLQITFPEMTFHDGRSDIALSLFLHNSYDGSEGVRMYFGAIRFICSNGQIYGEVLSQFYGKHTSGLDISNLSETVESTYDKLPVIKNRIEQLQEAKVSNQLRQSIENRLGKTIYKYVEKQEQEISKATNQWALYNILTYYISHLVKQRLRASYQLEVSKLFRL
jgi:hypothetical protein